jgi:hypothetical protein
VSVGLHSHGNGRRAVDHPKLSVVVTGRNDDRCPDQFERLIALQRTLAHSLRSVPFELLFIEWNPDPGRPYLGEALFLEQARHYVVTREAHRRLVAEEVLLTRGGVPVRSDRAFLLNHANSVGLQHARGEWVLITNIDNVFGPELGRFFESGWSPALAIGWQRRWGRTVLRAYAQIARTPAAEFLRRGVLAVLQLAGGCSRMLGTALGWALAVAHRAVVRAGAFVKRLDRRRARPQSRLGTLLAPIVAAVLNLLTSAVNVVIAGQAALRALCLRLPHRYQQLRRDVARYLAGYRAAWGIGRAELRPGTVYRAQRMEVNGSFAREGAAMASVDEYLARVRAGAKLGPWNPLFPWTEACGDFLLLDRESWTRIGGFPKLLGQLHADSVTVFKLIGDGHPVVLLDWPLYHIEHQNRFDVVPYLEYDFENVDQYFTPDWTSAEAVLVTNRWAASEEPAQLLVMAG